MNHTTLIDAFLLAGGCYFLLRIIDIIAGWYRDFTDPGEHWEDEDEDEGWSPKTSEETPRNDTRR